MWPQPMEMADLLYEVAEDPSILQLQNVDTHGYDGISEIEEEVVAVIIPATLCYLTPSYRRKIRVSFVFNFQTTVGSGLGFGCWVGPRRLRVEMYGHPSVSAD